MLKRTRELQRIRAKIDDLERMKEMFRKEVRVDDRRAVEIWVEERSLKGPKIIRILFMLYRIYLIECLTEHLSLT